MQDMQTAKRAASGLTRERQRSIRAGLFVLSAATAVVAAGWLAPVHAVLAAPSSTSVSSVAAATGATRSLTASASATATPSVVVTTAVFAHISGTKVDIHFPAPPKRFVAVGFHQADNKKAIPFAPTMTCHKIDSASKTKALLKKNSSLKLFQQPLRGRGDSNLTAADCAVLPKTTVLAPVTGVVTNVRHYKLYGYIDDLRVEIKPDGAPHLRVVMIHITSVKVKKGQRLVGGITPVAVVRHLKLDSTVNRFVPVKPVDHTHIQVNRDTFKGSY